MQSLSQAYATLGVAGVPSLRHSLQSSPLSLAEVARIAALPRPNFKRTRKRRVHDFSSENPQGIAYGFDNVWFLSSAKELFKHSIRGEDLYQPSEVDRQGHVTLGDVIAQLDKGPISKDGRGREGTDYNHFGDVHFHEGLLFVPVRSGTSRYHPVVVALSKNLELVGYSNFSSSNAFCAVNPWDGHLYFAQEDGSSRFDLYDISGFYDVLANRSLWGSFVEMPKLPKHYELRKRDGRPQEEHHIQGIAFSQNGRLYLARYDEDGTYWHNYIRVYDTMTGRRLSASNEYDFAGSYDEIEGLSVHPSGVIYVAVADHDITDPDEFEIYAFRYRDATPV